MCLMNAKISILGIASDGNIGYSARHEKFFNFRDSTERKDGIQAALAQIKNYREPFPISVLLHLAKNWRSSMMKYRLAVVLPGPFAQTGCSASTQSMIEILGSRQPLTDEPNIRFISTSGQWIMALFCDHDKKTREPPSNGKPKRSTRYQIILLIWSCFTSSHIEIRSESKFFYQFHSN
jgi:hypothetical protein